jgi:hypothetical protein
LSACHYADNSQLKQDCNNGTCESGICVDVECWNNAECGTNGWIGTDYCHSTGSVADVWNTYRTYTCNNAGTGSSSCSYSDNGQLKEDCADTCESNICVDVECFNESDCGTDMWLGSDYCNGNDRWDTYRDWTCNNAGTGSSSCSYTDTNQSKEICNVTCAYGECGTIECSDNQDCGTSGFLGNYFCNSTDIYDWFATYVCQNPGTVQSACQQNQLARLVKTCEYRCHLGVCVRPSVICGKDSDCGQNGIVATYCSGNDVWQNYRTWTCTYAGTSNAYCRYSDAAQLKQICGEGCIDGQCKTLSCSKDSDCGADKWVGSPYCNAGNVYQQYRAWDCKNAGTASSYCDHTETAQLKETCTYGCSGGLCLGSSGGTGISTDIQLSSLIKQTKFPRAGETVSIAFMIENKGADTLSNVQWRLETNTTVIEGTVALSPFEKKVLLRQVVFQTSGNYDIEAEVDPSNMIGESNEENNGGHLTIGVS